LGVRAGAEHHGVRCQTQFNKNYRPPPPPCSQKRNFENDSHAEESDIEEVFERGLVMKTSMGSPPWLRPHQCPWLEISSPVAFQMHPGCCLWMWLRNHAAWGGPIIQLEVGVVAVAPKEDTHGHARSGGYPAAFHISLNRRPLGWSGSFWLT
jgi:hypothetical protein